MFSPPVQAGFLAARRSEDMWICLSCASVGFQQNPERCPCYKEERSLPSTYSRRHTAPTGLGPWKIATYMLVVQSWTVGDPTVFLQGTRWCVAPRMSRSESPLSPGAAARVPRGAPAARRVELPRWALGLLAVACSFTDVSRVSARLEGFNFERFLRVI